MNPRRFATVAPAIGIACGSSASLALAATAAFATTVLATTALPICNASNPAPVTQDFRYLIYYVWSELPPAEKP